MTHQRVKGKDLHQVKKNKLVRSNKVGLEPALWRTILFRMLDQIFAFSHIRLYAIVFLMQSYPAMALDRRLQVDWARDAREHPMVLMSLRADFGPMG